MNMREQFVVSTKRIIENDEKSALVLAGISVASFSTEISKYQYRAFDAGILEQAAIGTCAGMAITGMIPIFHTIAPFLVERAYEQLKIDFGYQKLGGNFVTTGASLDYSSFGATHQCPADIGALKLIPNMQIVVPGTANEFKMLYEKNYNNGSPTYFRLSRETNSQEFDVELGKAVVVREGTDATVIAVGPMLDMVLEACKDENVTILYYTSVAPFDKSTLRENAKNGKILICEPYYSGALLKDICDVMAGKDIQIRQIGIPHEFVSHYGYTTEHYKNMGITVDNIKVILKQLIE